MNKTIVLFFVLLVYSCGKQQATETVKKEEIPKETVKTPKELEKEAIKIYQENPDSALLIFKDLIDFYEKENNTTKASFSSLSVASIYDENLNQPDSALVYANQSLDMWKKENDNLQVANLLKYVGLLEGKIGNYEAATQHIDEAIVLYNALDFKEGLAVANFNLAQVYVEKGEHKKGAKLLEEATDFWRKAYNKDRIFTNNLFAIELYGKTGDTRNLKKRIKENKDILSENKVKRFLEKKFEELLVKYEKR